MSDLPAELGARLHALMPAARWNAAAAARAAGVRRIALRVNTLVSSAPEVIATLARGGVVARAVAWLPDALVVEHGTVEAVQACERTACGANGAQAAGAPAHGGAPGGTPGGAPTAPTAPVPVSWYMQGLSSIAVAHALAPTRTQRVLDACAAPGSKTSHLAALMGNHGQLVAADASRARIFRLRDVLTRTGARAETVVERAERWGRRAPASFDAVLADVPCSAEGRALAGDESAAADWSLRKCKRLASEQKAILHSAIDACVPGGVVVYSTCTLGPEENEEVIERALKRYAGRIALEPVPVAVPGAQPGLAEWKGAAFPAELAATMRITPMHADEHPDGPWLEGFFIARLRTLA